ncbi:MAG: hypothetical protein FWH36_07905 [Lentimicrobiaceae bacterium]|nr:hypothetical protein [Lentimicrobiaceae bacterium]
MDRNRAIRRFTYSDTPMYKHAEGENETPTETKNNTVLGNVTSIIGSLSNGVSSVFNALTFNKQAEMATQYQLDQKRNNTTTLMWVFGGVALVVAAYFLLRKK